MPWNGVTGGDFTKAPWVPGCMTLTHDECMHVLTACQPIKDDYVPKAPYYEPISDFYVQSEYNKLDWEKAINGETYAVLTGYSPEFNTQGIDVGGIIPEPWTEVEPPIDEEPPTEEDTPEVVEPKEEVEAPTEEETTTEDPAE